MKHSILIFLISLPLNGLLACETTAPYISYFSASPNWNKVYPYSDKGALSEHAQPSMQVSSCREAALNGKYLMIGFGATYSGLTTSSMDVSYTGRLNDKKQCKLYNLPYANVRSFQQRKAEYDERTRMLRTCGELIVADLGANKLKLAEEISECHYRDNKDGTYTLSGGYCLFSIYEDSQFKILPRMNQKCSDSKFLKQHKLRPMEVLARVNLFLAGQLDKNSNDLEPLKSMALRLSVEPTENQATLSEDWGFNYPRWPADYRYPNLHLGAIELIQHTPDIVGITVPFLVDHVCNETVCDFSLPVAAELTLNKLAPSGKKEWLATWFEGDVAPPQFQGLLENNPRHFTNFTFEQGVRYSLEVKFANPKEDFTFLNRGLSNRGLRLPGIKLGGSGLKIGSEVPVIKSVEPTPKLPTVSEIKDFQVASSLGNLDYERGQLGNRINFVYWPPFYNKVCGNDGRCSSPDLSQHVTLNLEFSIKGMAPDNEHFLMDKIQIRRKSFLLSEYSKQVNTFPYYWCKR